MSYASFQDYRGRFLGKAIPDEADFDRLALRASALLDRMTMGRAARYRDAEGRLALACCAVTEKLYALEEACRSGDAAGKIAAETVGDYRVEFRRLRGREENAELEALAELYLFGTGLLYRGIGVTDPVCCL